ncbi:MAG: hypothetical protein MJ072_04135, partial [Clostridia bacterium]|nr:hypothetical protein [Clostridia bacterium]
AYYVDYFYDLYAETLKSQAEKESEKETEKEAEEDFSVEEDADLINKLKSDTAEKEVAEISPSIEAERRHRGGGIKHEMKTAEVKAPERNK